MASLVPQIGWQERGAGGQDQARSTNEEEMQEGGRSNGMLEQVRLDPLHRFSFAFWPSSLVAGLAVLGSQTRARPEGHQD